MRHTLYIDIETYSAVNLRTCGVYRYVADPSFDVVLIAYALDGGGVEVSEALTPELAALLNDSEVDKVAHNAMFERVCLSTRYRTQCPGLARGNWKCSAVLAAAAGYPMGLDNAARAMRLPVGKMEEGKELIELFCCPHCDRDGRSFRVMPADRPEEWRTFREYCRVDVEVCRQVWAAARYAEYPGMWQEYRQDAIINDRGIGIDTVFLERVSEFKDRLTEESAAEFNRLTGVEKAGSGKEMKAWMASLGIDAEKTDKATLEALAAKHGGIIGQAVQARKALTKSSLAKYNRMADMEVDGRIRGAFQFYGASRTGRFAGRGIQPQNMPRNKMPDIDSERRAILTQSYEEWRASHPDGAETLSQLLRTAFIPSPGRLYAVADYAAVEARVLSWLAGEEWRMRVFEGDGKIYEATASKMFRVPIEAITKDSPYRDRGKVSDLALGYQGGPNALKAMGALSMGIKEAELPALVRGWRASCPHIVRFWGAVEAAAVSAIRNPDRAYHLTGNAAGISFSLIRPAGAEVPSLRIKLPGGRCLHYVNPSLGILRGHYVIKYYEEDSFSHRWIEVSTYGGKLTENIVQAFCRDLLTAAEAWLELIGVPVVMHVHDEVVAEVPADRAVKDLEEITSLMCAAPAWAKTLPLRASGFLSEYYRKD